jgi:hypothetical protein
MADDHKKVLDYILASHSPVIGGTIHRMKEKYAHLKDQDPGDLYEAATNAAMTAIHGHDPDRGAKLSTYMSQKIANALLQRFQPTDVAATDRAAASRSKPTAPSDLGRVQTMNSSGTRGEIESAGGSVSDDGSSSGVSIIRNTAADFAAKNPHMRSELERKTQKYEAQQAKKQPVVAEAPPPPPKPAATEQPKMIIRRKQVESSLPPEHLDRMKRIDGKKVPE